MRKLSGSQARASAAPTSGDRFFAHRNYRRLLTAGTALAGLSFAGMSLPANAAAIFWDGGGGTSNWGTKNNWSGNVLPGSADDVTIDANAGVNTSVVLNVTGNVKTLTIDKGDSLSASNGKNLTVHGGGASVVNNGQWSMNATTSNTILTLNGSSTLAGAGILELSDDAQNIIRSNAAANVITHSATHTIQGSGALLNNQAGMVNEGTIRATGATAALVIDPSGAGFINKGVLQAAGAAGLTFKAGEFTNTGFSIDVLTGSRLDLNSGSIVTGGALTTAGTGIISANNGAKLDGVTLSGNAVQGNGSKVTIANGLTNNGLWSMNATTSNTILTLNGGGTLGGTGVLSLSDDTQNFINSNAAANVITNAATHTIQGSGALLNNQAGMVNEGTIRATGATAALVIDPSGAGFINKGVLQAAGAAGLTFKAGEFTNTGFSIDVLTGSRLDLNSGSIVTGGALTTAGTGIISANNGAKLDGVTLSGNAVQGNGSKVTIANGLTNNGLWSMDATTSNTILIFNGSSTLAGAGILELSDDAQNIIRSNAAANVITNAATHTIQGSGRLLNNQAGMVNEGTIRATGATAALVIDPSGAGFENRGTLRAAGAAGIDLTDGANTRNTSGKVGVGGGSRIDVTGNYQQTGGLTIVELGGLLTATGNVNISGGTLGGNGVISANVNNSGGVTAAGMSVGLLTIDGKYTQSALGAFEVEIDSLASFDVVRVTGAATLDGLLDVIIDDMLANSSFAVGSTFEILNAASITGTFSLLTDNYSELVFSHRVGAGSLGGESVYLTLIENHFASPVEAPEPLTLPLLGAGIAWLGALRHKMRRE